MSMSIQTAYRFYVEKKFIVNRKYQRKLVWTIKEKQSLIDSILCAYPIPLILLAELKNTDGTEPYEIIDGMQRLHAIFGFIENRYSVKGKFFDVSQFTRAQQTASEGHFTLVTDNLLDSKICADFLDYELAVTIYLARKESEVVEIFGRINSSGRQLMEG